MPFDGGHWRSCGRRSWYQCPQRGHSWGQPVRDAAAGAVLGERPRHRDASALRGCSVQRMHQSCQFPSGCFQLVLHVVKYHHGSPLLVRVWAGWVAAAVLRRGLQQARRRLWSGLVKAGIWSDTSPGVSPPGNLLILVLFPRGRGVFIVLRIPILLRVPGLALGVGQGSSALGVPVAAVSRAQADAASHHRVPRSSPGAVGRVHQQQPARRSSGDDFGGDPMPGGLLLRGNLDPVKHFSFQREVVLRKSKKQLVRASESRPQSKPRASPGHPKGCVLPVAAPISLSMGAGCGH